MNVAVAAALGSETCTLTHARLALRGGCSGKEIAEALLAARFVKASTVFSTALPALEMMVDEK
jgi:AhpD family alkylhydroperoxidase